MANILIGYDKIKSDKSGTTKHYVILHLVNEEPKETDRSVGHVVTDVFLEGQVVGGALSLIDSVEVNGDMKVGSYCRVLKESIDGQDKVSYIGFSPRKK